MHLYKTEHRGTAYGACFVHLQSVLHPHTAWMHPKLFENYAPAARRYHSDNKFPPTACGHYSFYSPREDDETIRERLPDKFLDHSTGKPTARDIDLQHHCLHACGQTQFHWYLPGDSKPVSSLCEHLWAPT